MPNDIVHIGSFAISQGVLNVIGPLAGTIVGGLITYFVTRAIEHKKWKQSRQERLSEFLREGIIQALEWLEPMQLAISKASMRVTAILHDDIEQEEILETWPNLVSQLAMMDIRVKFRVLLPEDIYQRGRQIVRELEALRAKAVEAAQEVKMKRKPSPALNECFGRLNKLDTLCNDFERKLIEEYKSTFI